MTRSYIPADVVEQIRNARGFNVPWDVISSKLGIPVDDCRQAIGLPSLKQIPEQSSEPDLFSGMTC
jgi:hypothetical protein